METYYIVYKITNKITCKFYIGTHKTINLNDNYMGSGKYLKRSIEKHGPDKFVKEILHVYDTPDMMYAKEAEIVNEDFLAEENTYNLKVGGWDHINSDTEFRINKNRKAAEVANRNGNAFKNKKMKEYDSNPKHCKCCGKMISYEKRMNKYCNSSCAAKITNKTHPKKQNNCGLV